MSNKLISDDELKGFDLKKYAGLEQFSYEQWFALILHRSWLWQMADNWKEQCKGGKDPFAQSLESARQWATEHGLANEWTAAQTRFSRDAMQESVRAPVTALLESPLDQAFILPPYLESRNPLATASIRLRPQPYAGTAPQEPDEFNAALFGTLDDVPQAQAYETASGTRRVLLEVDIDAPNDQLIEDFKRWLGLWRQVTNGSRKGIRKIQSSDWGNTSIERWLTDRLVAYIDLKLVSKFLIRDFPEGKLAKKLGFKILEWDSAEERLVSYTQEFFGPEMSDWLYFQSFDEERRVEG
ncbi:DUF6387 family protein [Paraburkholderia tropica]|uniref:DUF6387 family protein n=1 Tax=Paraburkholderia tropica TaxID=92647 RepID=UPI002AB7B9A3|nr:DUF6387 family protein [Paraburkholderia tropica]